MHKKLLLALALALAAFPAKADGVLDKLISSTDKARLAAFKITEVEALAEAKSGGSAADLNVLNKALSGNLLPIDGAFDATGKWRCRIIKVGGTLPLTVYGNFKCQITDDGSGWYLEKISGSQRVTGRFYTNSSTEMTFLGAGHVNNDPPRKYGEVAEQDQVALATRRGKNKLVLEFPAPKFESKLDILVLERQ